MDPNATLEALADALEADDLEQAEELRHALAEWLDGGGFPPDWARHSGRIVMNLLWRVNLLKRED